MAQTNDLAVTTRPKVSAKEGLLERLLDPIDRLVEGIYSVLIILTFTLAIRAHDAQNADLIPLASTLVRQLFWAALGCAVAWGIIDGIMYVLTCVFERGQDRRLYRAIQGAASEDDGIALLADELDDELEPLTTDNERKVIYAGLYRRLGATKPPVVGFERSDFGGAIGIFLVAFGAAMPVTLPLLLLQNYPYLAVRVSNIVALAMLFGMGYRWAQYSGGKPLRFGLLLAGVGVAMVLVAIPLGG